MERIVVGDVVMAVFAGDENFLCNMTVNYVPMSRDDKWILTDDQGTYYIENCDYIFKANRSK